MKPESSHTGRIHSLHVSSGGVPKRPVAEARVAASGMKGDRQRNLKHHGGPDRALCLYSLERIEALRAEGHPIEPGSVGENVTIAGLPWESVVPGARLRIGQVLAEVTSYAMPCRTIRDSFIGGRSGRISERTNPGWSRLYARVLVDGTLRAGDLVVLEGGEAAP
jgi:MOSC domain-containing protein YiiM